MFLVGDQQDIRTGLYIQDILDMQLSNLFYWEDGMIKILPEILLAGEEIALDAEGRREMAWYVMQRIPVMNPAECRLDDWLCVNKQGKRLYIQTYRKILERASGELNFKTNYNAGYLHILYGYLEIASGRKTINEVADEYGVTKYYLLKRIFKGMSIEYLDSVIEQVANIKEVI